MKKRILSIVCAVAILATMLSVGVIGAFANSTASVNVAGIDPTQWTGDTANIVDNGNGGYLLAGPASKATKTITSADTYNLGDKWEATITIGKSWNASNSYSNPYVVSVGALTAIVYDCNRQSGHEAVAAIELKKDGNSIEKLDLAADIGSYEGNTLGISGVLKLSYDNGTATVTYRDQDYITENVGTIDFSAATASISIMGNYITKSVRITDFTMKTVSSAPTSSEPTSSEPASSEPASSEPASSEPASSEPASSEPASSIAPPMPTEKTKITEIVVSDWEGDTANIIEASVVDKSATGNWFGGSADSKEKTITTVNSYNLGNRWNASITIGKNRNASNSYTNPYVLKIGDLEAIVYDIKRGDSNSVAAIELINGETSVKKVNLPAEIGSYESNALGISGDLKMKYDNGNVILTFRGVEYINENVGVIDFSEAKAAVSLSGNYIANSITIRGFSLESFLEGEDNTEKIPTGEKITTPISGALVAEMWDNSDKIVDGVFSSGANASKYTLTSVKKYDLGTDWRVGINFKSPSGAGNAAGQPTGFIVGDIEVMAYNTSGEAPNKTNAYIGLNVKGKEVAKYDFGAGFGTQGMAYGGVMEASYKDGKIVVYHNNTEVLTYDATDDKLDFTNVNFGLVVKGNWFTQSNWQFKINEFSAKTADCGSTGNDGVTGDTGDSRNLVTPVIALVVSACAVAFIAINKKVRA